MFQPMEFMDGQNIVIIDNVPHYCYTGVSYLERLKNGLSLDYVFQQEDVVPSFQHEITPYVEPKSENTTTYLGMKDFEVNYEYYEQKKFQVEGIVRNGKWPGFKKINARNMKKSTIKSNGYKDKLFYIEQNLPDLFDEYSIEFGVDYYADYYDDYHYNSDDSDDYYYYY